MKFCCENCLWLLKGKQLKNTKSPSSVSTRSMEIYCKEKRREFLDEKVKKGTWTDLMQDMAFYSFKNQWLEEKGIWQGGRIYLCNPKSACSIDACCFFESAHIPLYFDYFFLFLMFYKFTLSVVGELRVESPSIVSLLLLGCCFVENEREMFSKSEKLFQREKLVHAGVMQLLLLLLVPIMQ